MVLLKRHLVIFGGFHDNLSECKYFNDVHVFSLEERSWRKVTISGQAPGPRSGCCMICLQDGRILVKKPTFCNFTEFFICLFLKCPYYFNFTISLLKFKKDHINFKIISSKSDLWWFLQRKKICWGSKKRC